MNITIRPTKVETEMLKELQKKDKRYKKGVGAKVENDVFHVLRSDSMARLCRKILLSISAA